MNRTSEPLGISGVIVEVDEAKFGLPLGLLRGRTAVGGIERGTDKTFLFPFLNETLPP